MTKYKCLDNYSIQYPKHERWKIEIVSDQPQAQWTTDNPVPIQANPPNTHLSSPHPVFHPGWPRFALQGRSRLTNLRDRQLTLPPLGTKFSPYFLESPHDIVWATPLHLKNSMEAANVLGKCPTTPINKYTIQAPPSGMFSPLRYWNSKRTITHLNIILLACVPPPPPTLTL